MTTIKNKIIISLTCILLLIASLALLSSCNNDKTYNVTFMIRNNAIGDWQQLSSATAVNGVVSLPETPEIDGYVFHGWYTDKKFGEGSKFDNKNVKQSTTVYARYEETTINISLNGEASKEEVLARLSELTDKYSKSAADLNLTLDSWYTDAAYSTKYVSGMDAVTLYGRYIATITYENGYETLYKTNAVINSLLKAPHTTESKFIKRYMSPDDISYVDKDGKTIDFDKYKATQNATITTLWKTPDLIYKKMDNGKYCVSEINKKSEVDTYPVISILSKNVTVESGVKADVVAVTVSDLPTYTSSAAKIIINDGIEYVSGLTEQSSNTTLKEVVLPSTLKVLENSFWYMNGLKSIELPIGLEVIIDCFWKDYSTILSTSVRGNDYDFTIKIPSSVTNMSLVPNNLDLTDNSLFTLEKNNLFKVIDRSKILCTAFIKDVKNGAYTVEEGVTGVQVGVLDKIKYDTLVLPSTFVEVGYNNDISNYSSYTGNFLTASDVIANPDTVPVGAPESYAIVGNLDNLKAVYIGETSMPQTVGDYAFVSTKGVPYNGSIFTKTPIVYFVGEIEEADLLKVSVTAYATLDGTSQVSIINNIKSGDALTTEEILTACGIDMNKYNYSIKANGEPFKEGVVKTNQYITVSYFSKATGFTYSKNTDGTYTATGFDINTAELLDNGTYRVFINGDSLNFKVSAIADGAFKGNNQISQVYIASTVQTIGKEAFMNTSNLERVIVSCGGLKYIEDSAFENIGSIYDEANNSYVINPQISEKVQLANKKVQSVVIQIPLADLVSIKPYAFKSKAIASFTPVKGEEKRYIYSLANAMSGGSAIFNGIIEGKFYYKSGAANEYLGIIQYMSKTTEEMLKNAASEEKMSVNVYDVRLIAVAGGSPVGAYPLGIGDTYRGAPFAAYFKTLLNDVLRYEVMEGSVYFSNNSIELGVVSKIHKNAFTDVNQKVYIYMPTIDTWLNLDKVQTQDSSVFEDCWWNGKANSENTFMKDITTDGNTILGQ